MEEQVEVLQVDPTEALSAYVESLRIGASPIYETEARKFLNYSKGKLTQEVLMRYLTKMKNDGYSPGSIVKVTIPTIRKLYKVNNLKWPLRRGEWPTLKEGDVYAPALEPGLVNRMIDVAKTTTVHRMDRALLVLATIYGMRRVEIAELVGKDVDLATGVLLVRTAKGGRERWHLIPKEINDYLQIFKHLREPVGVKYATNAYQRIEKAAGIERMPDVGWHAIRRILVRLLVEADLPAYTIDNFLRWKRGGSDMQRVYYSSTVVGERGQRVEVGKMDREVDERVFSVHPFLKKWAE